MAFTHIPCAHFSRILHFRHFETPDVPILNRHIKVSPKGDCRGFWMRNFTKNCYLMTPKSTFFEFFFELNLPD